HDRHTQRRHLEQVARDRFALTTLLRAHARIGAGRVDESDERHAETLGHAHQPERLAVALGLGHAIVAPDALLGVTALLLADDHHRLAIEPRRPADDGMIVGVHAVAV